MTRVLTNIDGQQFPTLAESLLTSFNIVLPKGYRVWLWAERHDAVSLEIDTPFTRTETVVGTWKNTDNRHNRNECLVNIADELAAWVIIMTTDSTRGLSPNWRESPVIDVEF